MDKNNIRALSDGSWIEIAEVGDTWEVWIHRADGLITSYQESAGYWKHLERDSEGIVMREISSTGKLNAPQAQKGRELEWERQASARSKRQEKTS
jgi:hypothetical protein